MVVGADASQARIEKLNGSAAYTIVMWANTSAGMGTMSEPFTVPGESKFLSRDMHRSIGIFCMAIGPRPAY